jgi:hypothetical protein
MLLNKVSLNLALLASQEESRYALQAIAVEPEVCCVTNGHYLVTVAHQTAVPVEQFPQTDGLESATVKGTVLIARDAAISAAKAIPNKTTLPVLKTAALGTDGKLYVNQLDSVQSFKGEASGTFPNWRMVMPNGKPVTEICISADYLETLAKFIRANSGNVKGRATAVRLTVYPDGKPMRLDARTSDGQDIMAVLMPMRLDGSSFAERPDQTKAREKTAEAIAA